MTRRAAAFAVVAVLLFAPPAAAVPYDCRHPAYLSEHKDECAGESGVPFLLGGGQPTGGGNGGGLIGTIRHLLGI